MHRFTRDARLRKPADFRAVFDSRPTLRSSDNCLTCLASLNGTPQSRLGLAIAKKQVRTAIGRNRVKRQVRDSFRHHQAQLAGLDIVVLGRRDTAAASKAQLRASAERHWMRLAKLRDRQPGAKSGPETGN